MLSYWTGYAVFDWLAQRAFLALVRHADTLPRGLFPIDVDRNSGKPERGKIRVGSGADSFYEYIAKQAALSRFSDELVNRLWLQCVEGILDTLTVTMNSTHRFVCESTYSVFSQRYQRELAMDHLVCFLPGALQVGSGAIDAVLGEDREGIASVHARHNELADGVRRLCVGMYDESPSGLAPEIFRLRDDTLEPFAAPAAKEYKLRPETLEALYYEAAELRSNATLPAVSRIVAALKSNCEVAGGFASITDVTRTGSKNFGPMESYFVSETLKYAFLAAAEDPAWHDLFRRGDWVFNTEGHPLRVLETPLRYGPPSTNVDRSAGVAAVENWKLP